jgi:hypothetical protein
MGCYIHLFQEKKVNGKWVTADKWAPSSYEDDDDRLRVDYDDRLYTGRNYRLFSVLAGVRNGVGFADVKTGVAVIPIALPRGVPTDCCPEYKAEVDAWGSDGHSHSWLTLHDIMAYPFKSAGKRGVMPLKTWQEWRRNNLPQPESWSGMVSGPNVKIIDEAMAAGFRDDYSNNDIYVEAEWSRSLRDDCEEFLTMVLPRLQELESLHGVGNARIVFFFDN